MGPLLILLLIQLRLLLLILTLHFADNHFNEKMEQDKKDEMCTNSTILRPLNMQLLSDFNRVQGCSVETVRNLLDLYGGPLNKNKKIFDGEMKSLLHIACRHMGVQVVKMMVEDYNFDPNDKDPKGNTALHIACQAEKNQTVLYLLNSPSCNPNIRNEKGMTPLHIASQNELNTLIRFFLNSCRIDEEIKDEVRKSFVLEDAPIARTFKKKSILKKQHEMVGTEEELAKDSRLKNREELQTASRQPHADPPVSPPSIIKSHLKGLPRKKDIHVTCKMK